LVGGAGAARMACTLAKAVIFSKRVLGENKYPLRTLQGVRLREQCQ
jgi:hypothetical protein